MTKRDFLVMIINRELTEEVINYAKDEIEKINYRNANRKPSKTKIEKEDQNKRDTQRIYDILLASNTPLSIKEIIAQDNTLADYSTQKISALLKPLKDENKVVRTLIKKVAYYSIA